MNEIFDQNVVGYMLKLFVIVLFLLVFWLLEAVWQHDKRWLPAIIIFPPLLILAIIQVWEFARGRCFFTALFVAMVLLISGVAGYNFALQLWIVVRDVSIWPYYVVRAFI